MAIRACNSAFSGRLRNWRNRVCARRILAASRRDEDGGALVEFTVMMPVFFLIVFGIIEWGSIFYLQNNMVNAAREAARAVAVQNLSTTAAQTKAQNYLAGAGQTFTIVVTDKCNSTPKEQDVLVQISVGAASASLVNFLGLFTNATLRAEVTMRKENTCP